MYRKRKRDERRLFDARHDNQLFVREQQEQECVMCDTHPTVRALCVREMKGDRMTSVFSDNGKSISRILVVVILVKEVFQVCLRKGDDNNLDRVTTTVGECASNK